MKGSLGLLRIAGIRIGIHYTWLLAFVLITWSLAQGFFPRFFPGWSQTEYWITGVIAALTLFLSVLIHELAHSFVAKASGLPVENITLFIFGGVSNIGGEMKKPRAEFVMAVIGPVSSLVLAAIFWGLRQFAGDSTSPLAATFTYLALVNALLGAFNLLPGFPLDGGRVLRSILWGITRNIRKATNIAATVGQILAFGLIGFGVFQFLQGDFLGGLWVAFIGWFLNGAADASRQEVTLQEHFRGVRVKDIMDATPETVTPEVTVADVVKNIFLRRGRRAAPVCRDGRLAGIVTLTDVKELPQQDWATTAVSEIMATQPLYSVRPEDDLGSAFRLLAQYGINQVLVLQDGKLAGLLSRADVIQHLQLSQEIGMS
ncbi:MAG: site-2 protease family protein [Chloroflexi bacterium]|nr:site-2 protease family protein [Chloroflexota bacterium]